MPFFTLTFVFYLGLKLTMQKHRVIITTSNIYDLSKTFLKNMISRIHI